MPFLCSANALFFMAHSCYCLMALCLNSQGTCGLMWVNIIKYHRQIYDILSLLKGKLIPTLSINFLYIFFFTCYPFILWPCSHEQGTFPLVLVLQFTSAPVRVMWKQKSIFLLLLSLLCKLFCSISVFIIPYIFVIKHTTYIQPWWLGGRVVD